MTRLSMTPLWSIANGIFPGLCIRRTPTAHRGALLVSCSRAIPIQEVQTMGSDTLVISPASAVFVLVTFEGPDRYAQAGGLGVRMTGLARTLADNGFEDLGVSVAQPAGMSGDVKLVNALTMENIASAVVADGLASVDEIHVRFAASMMSRSPTTADNGYPVAIALPNAARSGTTSAYCW